MKKLFVVSSTEFKSLKGAFRQVKNWDKEGCLDGDCCIYEVSRIYEVKKEMTLIEKKNKKK